MMSTLISIQYSLIETRGMNTLLAATVIGPLWPNDAIWRRRYWSPPVPHICVSELGQHWFRQWLVVYSAPSHYLNQCWITVDWNLRNKLQWNFNQNTKLIIHENASGNIVCKMEPILFRGRRVNTGSDNVSCLAAPNHYLNQCSLTINMILRHLFQGNVFLNIQEINPQPYLKSQPHLPGDNELKC